MLEPFCKGLHLEQTEHRGDYGDDIDRSLVTYDRFYFLILSQYL